MAPSKSTKKRTGKGANSKKFTPDVASSSHPSGFVPIVPDEQWHSFTRAMRPEKIEACAPEDQQTRMAELWAELRAGEATAKSANTAVVPGATSTGAVRLDESDADSDVSMELVATVEDGASAGVAGAAGVGGAAGGRGTAAESVPPSIGAPSMNAGAIAPAFEMTSVCGDATVLYVGQIVTDLENDEMDEDAAPTTRGGSGNAGQRITTCVSVIDEIG